jgi:hyperosmotically inducible protein
MRRTEVGLATGALLLIVLPVLGAQSSSGRGSAASDEKAATKLSREIHHEIAILPFYSVFDSIHFTLNGKKVILTGQVLRHSLREDAEEALKSIEGVGAVENKIEILPASPSDDELRRAIYRAVYEDSTLAPYAVQNVPPVHIIVNNGNVALEGWVESLADKNLAGRRAGNVAGVHNIKNDLVVHAKGSAQE